MTFFSRYTVVFVSWVGHICLLKHVIEGKIKVRMEVIRRGRRRKQLLADVRETRGYCKLKEGALDRNMWKNWLWETMWTCRTADNKTII